MSRPDWSFHRFIDFLRSLEVVYLMEFRKWWLSYFEDIRSPSLKRLWPRSLTIVFFFRNTQNENNCLGLPGRAFHNFKASKSEERVGPALGLTYLPDENFHNFGALKSVVRRFWTTQNSSICVFRKLWKGSLGKSYQKKVKYAGNTWIEIGSVDYPDLI